MTENDVRECRDCRQFKVEFDNRGICFSCKKGAYSKIHFFVDVCSAFEKKKEEDDCATD